MNNETLIMEYFLGPVIGSALYNLGGFLMPFVTVGSIGILLASCLLFVIPNDVHEKKVDNTINKKEKLSFSRIIKVLAKIYLFNCIAYSIKIKDALKYFGNSVSAIL